MFLDLTEHLKELRETAALILPRVEKILAVRRNLRAFKDHLGVVRYCSSDVNAVVDTVEITHRTDEEDGVLEILPSVGTRECTSTRTRQFSSSGIGIRKA